MRRHAMRRCGAALIGAVAALCAAEGPAGAQYFMRYAGDSASRGIRDGLTVVTQAEQALDTGHRTLAGWLFWASDGVLRDAADALPDAEAVRDVGEARRWLERKDRAQAVRALSRLEAELRRLAPVWGLGDAEPKCAALLALAQAGDCPAALAGLAPLAAMARVGPARTLLDQAGERIAAARDAAGKGRGFEALGCAAEAKARLRRALLAARLTRAGILVSHARIMAGDGSRFRARWTLGRASRALACAGVFADAGSADAAGKIRTDIDAVSQALRGDGNTWVPLTRIEAKIVALIAKCCAP